MFSGLSLISPPCWYIFPQGTTVCISYGYPEQPQLQLPLRLVLQTWRDREEFGGVLGDVPSCRLAFGATDREVCARRGLIAISGASMVIEDGPPLLLLEHIYSLVREQVSDWSSFAPYARRLMPLYLETARARNGKCRMCRTHYC